MEIQNQLKDNESQCCMSYCKATYKGEETEVVNLYKCREKQISSGEMWNIRRNSKAPAIRKFI
jgi:hypothetical protein